MVRKGKFVIGKSKTFVLEQQILGHKRQLTKLDAKVELISAWITKKFGVSFLVEASARVKLKDVSNHLFLLKSAAPPSLKPSYPSVKKAKQKPQRPSGGQHSDSDNSEDDVMVVSDSDVDEAAYDDQASTRGSESEVNRSPLEDGEPEMERRTPPRQHKSKVQRNKMARKQVGTKQGHVGKRTEGQPKTVPTRNFQLPKGHQKYLCNWPDCKKICNQSSDLVKHQRTHTGEKPYNCTWPSCGKSFKTSSDCSIHRRTHTGEKPHVCNWPNCNKSFTIGGNLEVHRRIHTGVRPYNCGFCNLRFRTISNLTVHIRTHTGEKPYKCRFCSATFTKFSNQVKHEKNQHQSQ